MTQIQQILKACDEMDLARKDFLFDHASCKTKIESLTAALRESVEKLNLLVSSIDAAYGEGLHEVLQNTQDERLKDLLDRRILHHYEDGKAALTAIAEILKEGK